MRIHQLLRRTALAATASILLAACTAQPTRAPAAATGSVTTASGLVYQSIQEGSGTAPTPTNRVRVRYRGTFLDGREFDSASEPVEFPLDRVIKCWTEGLQLIKPGGKARLTCPAAIAYGERGAGGVVPPNASLQFDVELISVLQ